MSKQFSIGFRAHDFGTFEDMASLSETVSSYLRPSSIQLAVKKILVTPPAELDLAFAQNTKAALEKNDVTIAILGCYINPVHPDEGARELQLRSFEHHLALANAFGCPYVGTETGSLNPNCTHHEHTSDESVFETFLASIRRLLVSAEKNQAFVTIEPVAWSHTIDSPRKMATVISMCDDNPYLKVIYDPVNLMPHYGFQSIGQETEYYDEALELLGDRIVAIHCKDYILRDGIKVGNLTAGTGLMDWDLQASLLKKHSISCPVLLENHQPALLRDKTILFCKKVFNIL